MIQIYTIGQEEGKMETAERYASIYRGKVVLISTDYPAHVLLPNQVALTDDEFFLLKAANPRLGDTMASLKRTLAGLEKKIKAIK